MVGGMLVVYVTIRLTVVAWGSLVRLITSAD